MSDDGWETVDSNSQRVRTRPIKPLSRHIEDAPRQQPDDTGRVRARAHTQRSAPQTPSSLDPDTQAERLEIRRRGGLGVEFSCPVIGCTVRQSMPSDADVRYSAKYRIWLCSDAHRRIYIAAMGNG